MWWILNSSLLAGACRDVPILVLVVCDCFFLLSTPLPTLAWDLQHPEPNNWHCRINPLPMTRVETGESPWHKNIAKQEATTVLLSLVCLICKTWHQKMIPFPVMIQSIAFQRARESERERSCFQHLTQSSALGSAGSSQMLGSYCL